jgi:hypothetical protein
MANPNNIKIRSELDRPLSITEMDTNFSELRDLINKFNGYTGADFFDTFNDRGIWTTSTEYEVKDLVRYNDSVYLCFEAHTSDSTLFESQYWKLWQGKYIRQVSSITELKTFGGFYDNDIASMLSLSEDRKGSYVWSSLSTLTSNDLDVVKVTSLTVGRWIHEDLVRLRRDYNNINVMFGHKYNIDEALFNYYDYVDMLLGKVYNETATQEEIDLVSKLNTILGRLSEV